MQNSNILKITGSAEIESALENDTEYEAVFPITTYVTGEMRSNQDGSYTYGHKAKISGAVKLIKGNSIIKGKDKSSLSKKLRGRLYVASSELGVDSEEFYERSMKKLINNWESVEVLLNSKS